MLKVENLRKVFRTEEIETIALNGVSFDVDEGEFVAGRGTARSSARAISASSSSRST